MQKAMSYKHKQPTDNAINTRKILRTLKISQYLSLSEQHIIQLFVITICSVNEYMNEGMKEGIKEGRKEESVPLNTNFNILNYTRRVIIF